MIISDKVLRINKNHQFVITDWLFIRRLSPNVFIFSKSTSLGIDALFTAIS